MNPTPQKTATSTTDECVTALVDAAIDQTRTAQTTISNTGSMIGLRKKNVMIGVLFLVASVLVVIGFWSMAVERKPKNATISFLCAITCMMTARHTATACIQSV